MVPLLGRPVPVITTAQGVRATRQDQPIEPTGVALSTAEIRRGPA
jgi:hypothetical protein